MNLSLPGAVNCLGILLAANLYAQPAWAEQARADESFDEIHRQVSYLQEVLLGGVDPEPQGVKISAARLSASLLPFIVTEGEVTYLPDGLVALPVGWDGRGRSTCRLRRSETAVEIQFELLIRPVLGDDERDMGKLTVAMGYDPSTWEPIFVLCGYQEILQHTDELARRLVRSGGPLRVGAYCVLRPEEKRWQPFHLTVGMALAGEPEWTLRAGEGVSEQREIDLNLLDVELVRQTLEHLETALFDGQGLPRSRSMRDATVSKK